MDIWRRVSVGIRMPRQLARQRKYFTGLVALRKGLKQTRRPISGAAWRLSFVKPRQDYIIGGREVSIIASSWASAQRALNLILSSLILISREPLIFESETHLVAHNAHEPELDDPVFRKAESRWRATSLQKLRDGKSGLTLSPSTSSASHSLVCSAWTSNRFARGTCRFPASPTTMCASPTE